MKLSNKVLLGFFGFVFIYLTAAFAELRLTGTPNMINDENSVAETANLPDIGWIIIENVDKYINVVASDTPRLEVRSLAGDVLKRLSYETWGDTLILSGFQAEGVRRINISAFIPQSTLRGIQVNHSAAGISGLQMSDLRLKQTNSRVSMRDNKIGNLQIDLSNRSFLSISETKLDTLSAAVDGSQVHISSPVRLMQGAIQNNSFVQVSKLREIHLNKDENSTMHFYP